MIRKILFCAVFSLVSVTSRCADQPEFSPATAPAVSAASAVSENPFSSTYANLAWHMRGELAAGLITGIFVVLQRLKGSRAVLVGKIDATVHALFNEAWDDGLIKNGNFKAAADAFFNNFEEKFAGLHPGTVPDAATLQHAFGVYVKLFTEHTGDDVPVVAAKA
jgi:hypothetical protein